MIKVGDIVRFTMRPEVSGIVLAVGRDERGDYYDVAWFDKNDVRHSEYLREPELYVTVDCSQKMGDVE